MQISQADWNKYRKKQASLCEKAADKMVEWLESKGGYININTNEIVSYAYALSTKYGEGTASLAAQMYDDIARVSKKELPSAEVAQTASLGEIKRAVNAVTENVTTDKNVASVVSKSVKQAGADTMLKNAIRDGAQFAWVPGGDGCAYCLMIASKGWQNASKSVLSGNHAEHIHPNCMCEFVIRFDKDSGVKGYDPTEYKKVFEDAEGKTSSEKLNSIRRIQYQENKDKINAQKRENYAEKKNNSINEREKINTFYSNNVQLNALDAPGYIEKFDKLTENPDVNRAIYESANEILTHRTGTNYEDLYLINASSGDIYHKLTTSNVVNGVIYDEETKQKILEAKKNNIELIAIHNHPGGLPPTLYDGVSAYDNNYKEGIVVGHNLEVYKYSPTDLSYTEEQCEEAHKAISEAAKFSVDFEEELWYDVLGEYGMKAVRL